MLIVTCISLTVNLVTLICLAPTVYRFGCSVRAFVSRRIHRFRQRNAPRRPGILIA